MAKKKTKAQRRQERNARSKAKATNMKNVQRKGEHTHGQSKNPLAPSGLRNNGNTCYYNSTIQSLAQVYTLRRLLDERCQSNYLWKPAVIKWDENKKMFTVEHLKMTLHGERTTVDLFLTLVKDILSKKSTTPSHLLDEVRSKNSQFRGYSQQDAHELCLSLISQMRDEEIALQKRAICNHLKMSLKNPSEEDKKRFQKYRHVVSHTPLDSVFGGQLVSWVRCCDCSNISVNFERFYDLSLSLPKDQPTPGPCSRRKMVVKSEPSSDEDDEDNDENEDEDSSHENENAKLTVTDRKKKRAQKKAQRKLDKEKAKLVRTKANNNGTNGPKEDAKTNGKISPSESSGSSCESEAPSDREHRESKPKKETYDLDIQLVAMNQKNGHHKDTNGVNIVELLKELELESTCKKNRQEFNRSVLQVIKDHDNNIDNKMLGDLLKNFITVEVLQGDNKYICEYCSKRCSTKTYSSKAYKGQLIALPPQTLIIQLKRFETTGSTQRIRGTRKCNTSIEFPLKLNLSPFTSSIYESLSPYYEPELNIWKYKQILDYNLFAVVVHLGDLQFGHYVAYIKVRKDELLSESKNHEKFVHLRQFFPNFDHVFQLWCMSKMAKKNYQNASNDKNPYNASPNRSSSPSPSPPNTSHHNNEQSPIDNDSGTKYVELPKSNESDKSTSSTDSEDNSIDNNSSVCDSSWFYCSDSDVRPCTEDEVLRQTSGQYFMLYERSS